MAKALEIIISEEPEELQKLYRKTRCATVKKRLKLLVTIKKRSPEMLSKNELAGLCKCDPNSVNNWRKLYLTGGIDAVMQHNWKGTSSKHVTEELYGELEKKLKNPVNGLAGYRELMRWMETEYGISIKYTTLYEYVKRNFGSKIKVARKSHIKKKEEDMPAFKKKREK